MKFINEGTVVKNADGSSTLLETAVTVRDLKIFNLPFGETCEVPEAYATPFRASNGARLPSIVERLAPQLKPADKEERLEWSKAPPKGRPDGYREMPVPSVELLVKQGYPEGVAEQEHKKALAAREEERKARKRV